MHTYCRSLVVIALVYASPCLGQESIPGPDYDQLKAMQWMIGDWEATWEVKGESILASAYSAGAKVRTFNSYSWMQNKNYIGLNFRDEINGKTAHKGFEMIARDPVSKKTVHWLFSVLGGSGVGEWSVKGNTWKLEWTYTSGGGAQLKGVAFLIPVNKDTHTWQMKEIKENGKDVPDTPLITFRRVAKKSK